MDYGSLIDMSRNGLTAAAVAGAFTLGFSGGFTYCLGMCGPVIGAAALADGVAQNVASESCDRRLLVGRPLRFQVGYHLGRMLMLLLLGAMLGYIGGTGLLKGLDAFVLHPTMAVWLRAAAGTALMTAGIWLWASTSLGLEGRIIDPGNVLMRQAWFQRLRTLLADGHWGLPLGALMALLPCVPLIAAGTAAFVSGSIVAGGLLTVAFGLGTMPALMGAGAAGGFLGVRARGRYATFAGFAVVILGIVTLIQAVWIAAIT